MIRSDGRLQQKRLSTLINNRIFSLLSCLFVQATFIMLHYGVVNNERTYSQND